MAPKKAPAKPLEVILESLSGQDAEAKILLVGQTGAGKTTVLNYLARFASTAGVPADGLRPDHIQGLLDGHVNDKDTESGRPEGESQTVKPKEYRIPITHKGRTTTIVVLDTPGFADTKGAEVDREHEKTIVEMVSRHHYLTCVLFVINGAAVRIHPTTRYTMTTITALMPRDIVQNVLILHSFLDSKEKCKYPPEELTQCFEVHPVKFYLDNPLALLQGFEKNEKGSAVGSFEFVDWDLGEGEDDDDGETGKNLLRQMFKGQRVMTQILEKVASFESYATNAIRELKENKDKITTGMLELSLATTSELRLQNEISEADRRIQDKEEAEDVIQTHWVLKDCEHYHYYCQHPQCAVQMGGRPCCFRMEAGHDQYEKWQTTLLIRILTLNIRRQDWRLAEDMAIREFAGKQAEKDRSFHCACPHPVSEHIGGNKEFELKTTILYAKEDIAGEKPEDVKARLTALLDESSEKVKALTVKVRAAYCRYKELGLPSSFERLLVAQKAYYEELKMADMGDKNGLDDMIRDVDTIYAQLKDEESVSGPHLHSDDAMIRAAQ